MINYYKNTERNIIVIKKSHQIFMLFLFLPIVLCAQNSFSPDDETMKQQVGGNVRISKLENENELIKITLAKYDEKLESKYAAKNENIEHILSFINIILVVIAIVIAIIGVGIPIIIYFIGCNWKKEIDNDYQKLKIEASDKLLQIKIDEKESKDILIRLRELSNSNLIDERITDDVNSANAIANNPKATPFESDWGKALIDYFNDRNKDAVDKFNYLLNKYPNKINFNDLSFIYSSISYCYVRLELYNKALFYADSAIALNPINVKAWRPKAHALLGLIKIKQALECSSIAIDIDETDEKSWITKGTVLEYMCKYVDALNCFEKAKKLNPDNHHAKRGIESMSNILTNKNKK